MNALMMLVALAANPDAGVGATPPPNAASMPESVRALFKDLLEPVTTGPAVWRLPMFDRSTSSDVYLVRLVKEIPKTLAGVQLSRLSSAPSELGFVVVGSEGTHLVIGQPPGDPRRFGVYGVDSCGPGLAGLALGGDSSIEWRGCWNPSSRRFELKWSHLPQLDR